MLRLSFVVIVILWVGLAPTHAQFPGDFTPITVENAASISEIATLEGHEGSINSVAFNLDGTLLASGGEDSVVRMWDIETGGEKYVLEEHTAPITAVAFNSDGTKLASTGYDLKILLWDTTTGDLDDNFGFSEADARAAQNQYGNIAFHSLVFSPEKLIAIGDYMFEAQVPLEEGMFLFISHPSNNPRQLSITRQSKGSAIALGRDNEIIFRADGRAVSDMSLEGHEAIVMSVAFSPDDTLLASASADTTIRLWNTLDVTTVAPGAVLEGHSDAVTSVAFSPDGSLIASGSLDGTLRLWDVATQASLGVISAGDGAEINSVAFSPDGTRIATAGSDGIIRLWGIAEANGAQPTVGVQPKAGKWAGSASAGGMSGTVSFTITEAGSISDFSASLTQFPNTCNINIPEIPIENGTFKLLLGSFDGDEGKIESTITGTFVEETILVGAISSFFVCGNFISMSTSEGTLLAQWVE